MKTPGHLQIETVQLAPSQEWSGADSHAWCFVRLSRGSAYWLDTARPRALNEGELLVTAPGVKALVRASQLNDVVLHAFNFDPEQLCGFFTLTERHFFDRNGLGSTEPVRFLPSTHPIAMGMAELLGQAETENTLMVRLELLRLAVGYFSAGMDVPHQPLASAVSAQHRFQEVISRMPDVELVNYTPEELAVLCGCSPRHFNRLFHAQFGDSPRARQTEMRLLKARQLLGMSDAKIVQVAEESGYRSLSLFNSLFKRRFGMSPSEWRQKARGSLGT
jgi:AraC-like DNA-binding protein